MIESSEDRQLLIKAIAVSTCVIFLAMSGCEMNAAYNNRLAQEEMIRAGYDPIKIRCAESGDPKNDPLCVGAKQ